MQEVTINKQARLSEHLTSSSVAALSHSSELDGLRLTPHFTLGELCKTSAKTADGNIPSHVHIENLRRLCGWLEMLRDEWNRRYGEGDDPIVINSGYRSPQVNAAVGGAKGSNHLTLLLERSPKGVYWLHFAVRPPSQENRRKIRFIQT